MKDYNKLISVFQNNAKGFENRMSLYITCEYLGIPYTSNNTRQLRRAFKELGKQNILIASNCKRGGGYWLTTKELIESDPAEKAQVEIMLRENYSRMKEIRKNMGPFKKALNQGDQLEFNY